MSFKKQISRIIGEAGTVKPEALADAVIKETNLPSFINTVYTVIHVLEAKQVPSENLVRLLRAEMDELGF